MIASAPHSAHALDPIRAPSQYVHDVWTEAGDLPLSTVTGIAQTADGYLWLGTQEGLFRFDGVRFEVFRPANTTAMRRKSIADITLGRDGSLWIAVHGGGVLRKKADAWETYGPKEGLTTDTASDLLADRKGRLWAATEQGPNVFERGRFSNEAAKIAIRDDNAIPMAEDRDGGLWFGSHNGLYRWRDGKVDRYGLEDGLPHTNILSAHADRRGRLWIGTRGGLAEWRDGRIVSHPMGGGSTRRAITAIQDDRDGNLWLGTAGGGLLRWREGKVDALGSEYGLSHITSLFEDSERNLWVGTFGGGLHRLQNGKFIVYGVQEGLSHDATYSAAEDATGAVWIGTYGGGLNRLKNGEVVAYTAKDGLRSENLGTIVPARNGDVWIATQSGLHRLRDRKLRAYTREDGLSERLVTAILEDRAGRIWVGNSEGLHRLEGERFVSYGKRDGLPGDFVLTLAEGRDGSLWIGTYDSGLARWKDGRFTTYRGTGLEQQPIACLYEDADGTLWIGTFGGGLVRMRNDRFDALTARQGLFDDNVLNIVEDDRHRLWMSSNLGLFRVEKNDIEAIVDGRASSLSSVVYGKNDGMRSAEANGGGIAARHRDGRLWFPTQKGVVVVDPERLERNAHPPPVVIERLLVGENDVALRAPIALSPGSADLEVHYSAPSFVASEKVMFRYRLEGYETGWVDAGSRRVAYYTNLEPGEYLFRVIARNEDGVSNEAGANLAFSIRPHFYQTTWFLLLCGTALLFGIWALHRVRLALAMARVAVFEERNRIAQEIHDGLTQELGGIAMQLEAARDRVETAVNLDEAAESMSYVQRARNLVEGSLEELHRLIWALRPARLEDADLSEAVGRLIAELEADGATGFAYRIEGTPVELSRELERAALRIAQEALFNATRHGHASRIEVQLDYEPQALRLTVKDNGRGFDPQASSPRRGRFGLRGMDERVRRLRGTLRVESGVGVGTTVVATFPRRGRFLRMLDATIAWIAPISRSE